MIALAGLGALVPTDASAQKWSVDAGVSAEGTWTSNAGLSSSTGTGSGSTTAGGGGGDEILNLRPHIRLFAEGERLKLSGSASLSAITYANGKQPSQLEPQADLSASLAVIERLAFIDAGLRAAQTSADIFGARPESGGATNNSVSTTQAHIAPRIEGTAGSLMHYRLMSENAWTHVGGDTDAVSGADTGGGYFGRHSVLLEHQPQPFGWRLEGERSQTRYGDSVPRSLVTNLARATVDYAVSPELTFGVHGGVEHTNFVTDNGNSNLLGVELQWRPSERTLLSAFEEKRFFGTAWKLAFDHRNPQFALNVLASRLLETSPQSVLDLPASDNVAALLDSILTTRFPDPVARANAVNELIAQQGLPTSTLQPLSLLAQRVSIVTLSSATATFIGRRNSVSLTAFLTRTEDAPDTGVLATASALTNNAQAGGAVTVTHRLSPTMALVGSADWSRIRSLEALGERSTQRSVRVRLNVDLQPRTTAYAGGRVVDFDSNVATSGREWAVLVGVDHRF